MTTDADILRLHNLHASPDHAILTCYRWDVLDPKHDFYSNDHGQIRLTLASSARREIIHRLLALNLDLSSKART